ncbi:MAG: hypothetical protein NC548_50520 [Lachnospiraceae bacterium]|nr:hypothetical protein [Lachnospiraceae bacterium]MCM1227662.1 hypothetical protein [Clostridium sp.]
MCKVIEDMRNDAVHEGATEIAKNLLTDGTFNHEKIASMTSLTLDEVRSLAKKQTA